MLNSVKRFFAKRAGNQTYWRMIMNIAISLIFFALLTYILGYTELPKLRFAVIITALYLAVILISGIIFRFLSVHISSVPDEEDAATLNNLTLSFIKNISSPITIIDAAGRITWFNRSMAATGCIDPSMRGRNIAQLLRSDDDGVEGHGETRVHNLARPEDDIVVRLLESTSPDSTAGSVEVVMGGRKYRLNPYPSDSRGKQIIIVVWNDLTELDDAEGHNIAVASIVIDNLDEIMKFVKNKYHDISQDVAERLMDFATSVGGILNDYERGKFIFIFERRHLADFTRSGFDKLLESIHEIRVDDGNLPVTVSIGVADIDGSLDDKERASNSALDMALQRGGDQVVLKNRSGEPEYFGGHVKGLTKSTKSQARLRANELLAHLSDSDNVILMAHRRIDFDALGACVGIARLAMFCGVRVNIVVNFDDVNLKRALPRLTRLEEYRSIFVTSAQAQDMLRSGTLLVICDVSNSREFESADLVQNAERVVYIDHHRKTSPFAREPLMEYIDPSASSTSELVAEFIELTQHPGFLSHEEAEIMLSGIMLDTVQFTRNTGTRTYSAALFLRGEGADSAKAYELFNLDRTTVEREAMFENKVKIYRGIIAIAVNDSDVTDPTDSIAASNAVGRLIRIDGVRAAFALCRMGKNAEDVKISARSWGDINVQRILELAFGKCGGGHYDAAGGYLAASRLSDVLVTLKIAIDRYIDENELETK